MAPHSSTLAWKIPWMEEPGGLPSMGLHRVGHHWSDLAAEGTKTTVNKRKLDIWSLRNLGLFYVWEDAGVWAHWAHSLHCASQPSGASILCFHFPSPPSPVGEGLQSGGCRMAGILSFLSLSRLISSPLVVLAVSGDCYLPCWYGRKYSISQNILLNKHLLHLSLFSRLHIHTRNFSDYLSKKHG